MTPRRRPMRLGVRLVRLAHAAWRQSSLAPVARPFSTAGAPRRARRCIWRSSTRRRCSMSTSATPRSRSRCSARPARSAPAYCTGVGKAMLAFLPEPALARRRWRSRAFTALPRTLTDRRRAARRAGEIRACGIRLRPRGARARHHLHRVPILSRAGGCWARCRSPATARGDAGGPGPGPALRAAAPPSRARRRPGAFRTRTKDTREGERHVGSDAESAIKRYGDTQVIHGVDLEIEDGEFCVFVGPSGCGKSTLLRMVAGLEETTEGAIPSARATSPGSTRPSAAWRWCSRPTRSTRT
jgi:hypothetical protein